MVVQPGPVRRTPSPTRGIWFATTLDLIPVNAATLATSTETRFRAGTVSLTSSSTAVVAGDALSILGAISGAGSLTKVGAGFATLSGSNSFTGGSSLSAGMLALGSANALSTTGTISFGGGTLQFSANNTTDYSNRFSNATGQQYAIDTNSQSVTLASALTSSGGALTKRGTGNLILTGTSTFTGPTTVSAGRLSVNGALGNTTVTVQSDAKFGGSGSIVGALAMLSGRHALSWQQHRVAGRRCHVVRSGIHLRLRGQFLAPR